MAHANYQFEKRRRDFERRKKQEAKRQRKADKKKGQGTEASTQPPSG